MLSLFLIEEGRHFDPEMIAVGVIFTFLGAIATRLLVIRYKIRSPRFSG